MGLSSGDPVGNLIGALAIAGARTVPLVWLVPAFGGPRAAPAIRVGLGLLLALLALPVVIPAVSAPALAALDPLGWLLLFGRELMVGFTVGLAAGVFFRAAEAAGRLTDVVRGTHPGDAWGAPSVLEGGRASPLADLYAFVATVLFLELGGLHHFAAAVARSYEAVSLTPPPAATDATLAAGQLRVAARLVVDAVAKLTESAAGLAAPVVVALLLADVVLGIVARAVPQLPVYFTAMPARALLGLAVVLIGFGALTAALAAGVPAWGSLLARALAAWTQP